MSVFDKELIINGKAVRSPEQQVFKNMKDIEILKTYIKESYKCVGELDVASISVAKSLTNVPDGVEDGWLLDPEGNLFKITGSDNYSLLLEFYASLKGPRGEEGPQGPSGGSESSGCYLLEHANEMTNLYAYTYEGNLRDIDNRDNFPLKSGDILIGDNSVVYKLMSVDEDLGTFTCIKFWELGGTSIPTINVAFEQMIGANMAQLTDDQFNVVQNNTIINAILPGDDVTPYFRTLINSVYIYYSSAIRNTNNNEYAFVEIIIEIDTKIAMLYLRTITIS